MSLQTLQNQSIKNNQWELVLDVKGYVIITKNKAFYAFGNSKPDSTITGVEIEPNTRIDNPENSSLWIKNYYKDDEVIVIKHSFL
jgi:hypothetical protein